MAEMQRAKRPPEKEVFCATCNRLLYYSVDDVVHLHVHNRSYWCDSVEFIPSLGYVDEAGHPVDKRRYVRFP